MVASFFGYCLRACWSDRYLPATQAVQNDMLPLSREIMNSYRHAHYPLIDIASHLTVANRCVVEGGEWTGCKDTASPTVKPCFVTCGMILSSEKCVS